MPRSFPTPIGDIVPASVEISWIWIDFDPSMSKTAITAALLNAGAKEELLDRGVYVIRIKPPFGIAYPGGAFSNPLHWRR